MAYPRFLIWAAAPLTAWCANFTSYGAGTACRKNAVEGNDCSEDDGPCSDRYDVVTEVDLEKCQMLCGVLMKSCHGLEFHPSGDGGRCELWKVPIGRTVDRSSYECFKSEDQSSDAQDGALVFQFQVRLTGADAAWLSNASNAAWAADVMDKAKGALDMVMQKPGWTFTMGDVVVMAVEGSDPPLFNITIAPSVGVLQLYAYLRKDDGDFKDGTEAGGRVALEAAVKAAMEGASWFAELSGGGTVAPTIFNRMLMEPPTPSPSPSPSSSGSPAPAPTPASDRPVDGATRCWSTVALFITTWVASTWCGKAD